MDRNNAFLTDTEEILIKGCLAGDRASQSKLYTLYAPEMLGVCMRFAKNKQEAEEILQEGFFRVFKYIHHFKSTGPFKGWMRKIMVNCALLRYKTNSKLHPVTALSEHNYTGAHIIPSRTAGAMKVARHPKDEGKLSLLCPASGKFPVF